jgi:hypothetical protein
MTGRLTRDLITNNLGTDGIGVQPKPHVNLKVRKAR